ncbi:MAG: hypothetical protein ACOYB3_01470 [Azonexus sp.]
MQQQLQYRPIGMVFLVAETLVELEQKITQALNEDKLLHGDWKMLPNGKYAQAVAPADWRPVPIPKQAGESSIVVPRPAPGRILG